MDVVVRGNFWSIWVWPCFVRGMAVGGYPLLKHCLSTANHVQPRVSQKKYPFVSDKPLNTRYLPRYQRVTRVRWPCSARDRPLKPSRLTASLRVLITAGTRIITCVARVMLVFITCATRGCPRYEQREQHRLLHEIPLLDAFWP